MLRRIVGSARFPDEEWLDWIRRTTRPALQLAREVSVKEWFHMHAVSKLRWAGHVARSTATTWLWRVSTWRDAEWTNLTNEFSSNRPLRPSRRWWMKFEDPMRRYCAEKSEHKWKDLAADRARWSAEVEAYAKWFFK